MINGDEQNDLERRGASHSDAEVVVIGLHGRDQDPATIERAVVEPLDDPTIGWLLPAAEGRSWYPHPFDDESAANARAVSRSINRLMDLVETIPVAPQHIVIMGFSQGACLACEFVARNPQRWGGLVAFTGGLMGPTNSDRLLAGDLVRTPVVLTAGERDSWITPDAVHSSGETFTRAGATVITELITSDATHHIRPVEIGLLRQVVNAARRQLDRGV